MALIDDLTGILGADAIEKIKTAGLDKKIERGEQLADYLDKGELPPDPAAKPTITLDDLTNTLKSFGTQLEGSLMPKFSEVAKTAAEEVWKTKAAQAEPAILAESTRWAHQMSQIERDYQELTGEKFDDAKLEDLNKYAKDSGKPITSPKAVYDEWIRDKKHELELKARDEKIAKLETRTSSTSIPGVTPGAATGVRAALKTFGKAVNAEGKTRAEVLNEKLATLERAS
jgi:hypothetical protein